MANKKQIHRSHRFYLPLLLIACLIGPNLASAATYYLDAVHGNDGNDGLASEWDGQHGPWQTLGKAKSTVVSGDTVVVRNGSYGTYYENAGSGGRTDWITYQAAEGHSPEIDHISIDYQGGVYTAYLIFDGITVKSTPGTSRTISIRGADYVKILNCDIVGRGAKNTGYGINGWENSNHVTISNCSFYGDYDSSRFGGFGHAICIAGVDNLIITDNDIKQMAGYGILASSMNVTIARNHIHQIGGDGIFMGGGDGPLLIEDNIVHDLYIHRPDLSETPTETTWSADGKTMYNPDATWEIDEPINWENTIEIRVISGNNVNTGDNEVRIEAVVSPTEIRFKETIKADPEGETPSNVNYYLVSQTHGDLMQFAGGDVHNVTIRGNQFYDCYGQILWIQPRKYNNPPKDIGGHNFLFENNLCWNSYADSQEEYGGTVCFEHIDGLTVRNNIVIGRLRFYQIDNANLYNNIVGYVQIGDNTNFLGHDYNIFCHGNAFSIGTHTTFLYPSWSWDKWNDPVFTGIFADYAGGDFSHASADSLGVGHGDPANYPISDILGVSRSIPPDAGCYEYSSGSGNSAPVLGPIGDKSIDEGSALIFSVSATDADSDTITYSATGLPNGATFSNQTFSWTPDYTQAGAYQVTFTAGDGTYSDSEPIMITVNGDSTGPVISNIQASDVATSGATITWTTNENATSQVEYGLTSGYANVTNMDSGLVISHSVELSGLTAETLYHYRVRSKDASENETIGSDYTFTTAPNAPPANHPPVANIDSAEVAEDSSDNSINVLGNDSDIDGDTLTITQTTQPDNGSVVITGEGTGLTYTPTANYNGSDSFTYRISDGNGGTDTATVNVTVTSVNNSPIAANDTTSISEDSGANSIAVLTNDSDTDGDTLTITQTTYPTHGSVVITGGGTGLTYTPAANYNGSDSFMYTISDGNGGSDIAMVSVTVTSVNDSPIANAGSDQTYEDSDGNGSEQVTLNGTGSSDSDGTIQSYVWSEDGTPLATGVNQNVTLSTGLHTIMLTVTDNDGATDTDTVIATVNETANQAPTASAGPDQTCEDSDRDGSEQIALSASGSSDPDNNIADFLWEWQVQDQNYSTGGATPEITLPVSVTPYTITLTVSDSDGLTDTDTVAITVGAAPAGSLTVTISTQDAIDNGAQWRVDSGLWQNSAATISGLSVGSHTVEFSSVTGWDTPVAKAIDIANGQTAQAEGEYTQQIGSLRITIEPYAAVAGGAKWRVNEGDWLESKAIVSNLAVGSCTVEFQAIDGWFAPDKTVEILNNQIVDEPVLYTPGEDNIALSDKSPPVVERCFPKSDDINAPLNARIVLHIVDKETGVDPSSVQILVNSNRVYEVNTNEDDTDNYVSEYGQCRRQGTEADYTYTYDPVKLYEYDQLVTVMVIAHDLAGNVMTQSIDYENEMSAMMDGDIPVKLNTTEGCAYGFKTQMRIFGGDARVGSDLAGMPQDNPVTVQDGQGNLWVTWQAGPDGNRDIYVAKKPADASYFENSIQVTSEPSDQSNPTLTVDDGGTLYLTWQDNRRGNWDIYFSRSLDGIHWSAAVLVTDSDANQTVPAIAVDHQSPPRVYIVWQDDRENNQDIFVADSNNGFITKTTNALTSDTYDQTSPVIAVDSDNNVYVAWTSGVQNGSTDIYGAVRENSAWTVRALVTDTTTAYNQSSPAIAVEDKGNNLHLLWVDDSQGNQDIYYAATDDGLPDSPLTGTAIVDDSTGADQTCPAIAVSGSAADGDLNVFACWQDERNAAQSDVDDSDIYFAESDGGSFGTNIWIKTDVQTVAGQCKPVMSLDEDGQPYVIRMDVSESQTSINYSGTTFISTQPLASAEIIASQGGRVGADPDNIQSVDDVCLYIPAGAFWEDVEVNISKVQNPPSSATLTQMDIIARYEFGPSSKMEFSEPVTITIPYSVVEFGDETVFWYNPDTDEHSQSGISDIEHIVISPTLHAIRFTTTHFTQYVIGEESEGEGEVSLSGSGSGGCSMSRYGSDMDGIGIFEFFLPYIGLFLVLMALKRRAGQAQK